MWGVPSVFGRRDGNTGAAPPPPPGGAPGPSAAPAPPAVPALPALPAAAPQVPQQRTSARRVGQTGPGQTNTLPS